MALGLTASGPLALVGVVLAINTLMDGTPLVLKHA
jgi:hypothetical protein